MAIATSTRYLLVGSGVAGGMLAEGLLAAGLGPVVMLEAGTPLRMRDYRTWLDLIMAGVIPHSVLSDVQAEYDATGAQPWKIEGGRLFVRGGSTVHWGGWCPRMKPEDFELLQRIGAGGLNWPWSYAQMEPYYERAEQYLQVAGNSADQEPPRKRPYPFEAPTFTLNDGHVIKALERLGISYSHIPVARNAKPINGMPQCVTTGTCTYCPLGARFTGDQPLDRLLARYDKSFELRLGAIARRILTTRKNRAVGIQYLDVSSGNSHTLEAQHVILCSGALETPKLLQASITREWPKGIGNDTDQVGRYLAANPFFFARGSASTNPRKLQEELHIPTLGSRHWDTPEYQREGKFLMNRSPTPSLNLGRLMSVGQSLPSIESATIGQQTMEMQGTIQTFSHFENRVTIADGFTRFGIPRTRIDTPIAAYEGKMERTITDRLARVLAAAGYEMQASVGAYPQRGDHAMCTARMSESAANGVVDSSFRVHGVDNLFVLSNAVFPSGAAANPTLTLVALGFRLLEQLVPQAKLARMQETETWHS